MSKTRAIGIRLPIDLWNIVKASHPDLSYSKIIEYCLVEKYCDILIDQDPDPEIVEPGIEQIEKLIDELNPYSKRYYIAG